MYTSNDFTPQSRTSELQSSTYRLQGRLTLEVMTPERASAWNKAHCPLFKLPLEIRHQIYGYLGIVKQGSYIGCSDNGNATPSDKFKSEVQKYRRCLLDFSSKQICDEILDAFYTLNGFEFFHTALLLEFMEAIGHRSRGCLRRLRIHYTSTTKKDSQASLRAYKSLRYLLDCSSLQSLEINARCVPEGLERCWLSSPTQDPLDYILYNAKCKLVEYGVARWEGQVHRLNGFRESTADHQQFELIEDILNVALQRVADERRHGKPE